MPILRPLAPVLFTLLLTLVAGPTAAQVPPYGTFTLLCRANFSGAFNLPDSAFFTSNTPALNDAGAVTIKLTVLPGSTSQGVWLGAAVGGVASGGVAYTSPAGAFLRDVSINAAGSIVFSQTDVPPNGLYRYDEGTGMTSFLTNQPFGASTWGTPTVDDNERVGFRAGFAGSGQAFVSYDGGPAPATHAAEVGLDVMSPYSFLFTPAFNNARQIAGKARRGAAGQFGNERPDEIRIFASDGSSILIAEDQDADALSPYSGFDNGVSLTDNGWVAFAASLPGGGRGVFFSDGVTTRTIALEGDPAVSQIDFFAPAANEAGWVAFRGEDGDGLDAIFVGDGTNLRRVIGEHDMVVTDLGTGRLDQHDSSPIFGGAVRINAAGDVTFAAGLTPPDNDQIEWGSGIFLASEALFTDGFESGDTTAWSTTVP